MVHIILTKANEDELKLLANEQDRTLSGQIRYMIKQQKQSQQLTKEEIVNLIDARIAEVRGELRGLFESRAEKAKAEELDVEEDKEGFFRDFLDIMRGAKEEADEKRLIDAWAKDVAPRTYGFRISPSKLREWWESQKTR